MDSSENGGRNGMGVSTRSFRKWQPKVVLTTEQSRRQSEVLRSAHNSLSSRETTVAFLNSYNQQLDGVPLQLALASDEGLLRVSQLLLKRKVRKEHAAKRGAEE